MFLHSTIYLRGFPSFPLHVYNKLDERTQDNFPVYNKSDERTQDNFPVYNNLDEKTQDNFPVYNKSDKGTHIYIYREMIT